MKNFIKKIFKKFLSLFGVKLSRINNITLNIYPIEASHNELNLIKACEQYSMTGPIRMWALIQSLKHVANFNLEGDLVECGVWKGGNLALMKLFSNNLNLSKQVVGFDTFEGMPDPTDIDVDYAGTSAAQRMQRELKKENIKNIHAYCSLEQVKKNLSEINVKDSVKLIKGRVEETLLISNNLPNKISILRLDTDWYESTKIELEILFPRLVIGGVLLIDDYGHFKGAKQAVDEYFKNQNVWLHYIDYSCRMIIKK
jgi:O-methyltransferase